MATIKDIQKQVDELKAFVKSRSRTWLIVLAVAVIILIVLFFTVFRNKGGVDNDYKLQINALDSTIKYQQKTIESLQQFTLLQDSLIRNLEGAYKKNRVIETKIIHHYEKIPSDVRSLDRDRLRREVADY